jgi:hypothetical protein
VASLLLNKKSVNYNEGAGTFGSLLHLAVAKLQDTHINYLVHACDVDSIEPL